MLPWRRLRRRVSGCVQLNIMLECAMVSATGDAMPLLRLLWVRRYYDNPLRARDSSAASSRQLRHVQNIYAELANLLPAG